MTETQNLPVVYWHCYLKLDGRKDYAVVNELNYAERTVWWLV
jgi:hypothetical protein